MFPNAAPPAIDLVIPVWNDAAALAQTLSNLGPDWPQDRIWIVDGGSRDDPEKVTREFGAHFLKTEVPSRAYQMNTGATMGFSAVILFLHADTRLPPQAASRISAAVKGGAVGGAFSRRFDHPSLFLRLTCHAADWRGRWGGGFFGDQAIFATRRAFLEVGGFPQQPLFEDLEFSHQLARIGPTVLLRPPVISSGRRFLKKGPFRQTMADFALTLRYAHQGPAIFQPADPAAVSKT